MVNVECDNDECSRYGQQMELYDEDSRTEWYKGVYECPKCHLVKIHHMYFDQNGLVTRDEITKDRRTRKC